MNGGQTRDINIVAKQLPDVDRQKLDYGVLSMVTKTTSKFDE